MFEIQNRIRIGHRGGHQRTRVLRRGRHYDLQSGRAIEPCLSVLAVVRARVAKAAPRHTDDHRNGRAPSVALLGRVVDELIESGRGKVVELHFGDRTLAGERRTDRMPKIAFSAIGELMMRSPNSFSRGRSSRNAPP